MKGIGNPTKEAEYMASKILNQEVLPLNLQEVRYLFSTLPDLNYGSIEEDMVKLKKLIIDKNELVKEAEAEKFSIGKHNELMTLLMLMIVKVDLLKPVAIMAAIEAKANHEAELAERIAFMPDYSQIGHVINNTPANSMGEMFAGNMHDNMNKFSQAAGSLLKLYGEGIPFRKHHKNINSFKELQLYLLRFANELPDSQNAPIVTAKLGQVLAILQAQIVPNSLNPFDNDLVMNLFHVLTHPKDFYTDCKLGNILNSRVGMKFHEAYGQFYLQFANIMLDGMEAMDEQEKISMLQGFGLPQDQTQLLKLCSQYVSSNQQQPGTSGQGV